MQVDFSNNYFEVFSLPSQFDIPQSQLVSRYRDLQKQLHPDKFAAASDAERRWSMQASSFVNEGYQTLAGDLSRAIYILQINEVSIDEETDTQMAPEFLMEQMELRESLEEAQFSSDPPATLNGIRKELRSQVGSQMTAFTDAAAQSDWSEARTITRQWQFLDKLLREVKSLEEQLDA